MKGPLFSYNMLGFMTVFLLNLSNKVSANIFSRISKKSFIGSVNLKAFWMNQSNISLW